LYNPIDLNRFSPGNTPAGRKEILVIYSGRLEKGKNLAKWIETAAYLHDKMPNTRFELYGEGSLKSLLQQQITDLNAGDYIQMKGFRKDIEDTYRKADAFLFLSEYESFGNAVIESILCGTPVITSPLPVMKEIFHGYPQFVITEGRDLKEQVLFKLHQLGELKKTATCVRESFCGGAILLIIRNSLPFIPWPHSRTVNTGTGIF
jgi:glycosyltransferase involved in cell wall biosynthesis